ncbi:hypothetical protein [Streptomyces synnematoformans]
MMNMPRRRAEEWLSAAAPDPAACRRQWAHGENAVALLPAGRFWDVLNVPERLGVKALDELRRLPEQEPGPTLGDFVGHRVSFFLPPDPHTLWVGTDIHYIGHGTWITVPAPYRTSGSLR